ncbi:MAG TPA: choline kinase [Lachnospiraceae bacterium]|nr:choline kinase [Lachnospiraceae bacterium]
MHKMKRAIILAAGEGSRLRPVTLETPKPLIKVNGIRMMDTSISALKANGIQDIYLVVGYKKELFHALYDGVPGIHIIENPYYLQGNNITSMYMAREYLPEAFVVEADIIIRQPEIFDVNVEKSGYAATWREKANEWLLTIQNGQIVKYEKEGSRPAYQLWGLSMWTKADGERLSEEIRKEFEDNKNLKIYWDEIALDGAPGRYDLGIRKINESAVCEIDTLQELAQIDKQYQKYF